MKKTICVLTVALTGALTISDVTAQEMNIKAMVNEVSDSRTTGQFFARAEVKLNLLGEGLSQARGIRHVNLVKAVDDTGKNLIKQENAEKTASVRSFKRLEQRDRIDHTIELLNPSRKAASIKEITGSIDLLLPSRDPQSVFSIKNVLALGGKPLSASQLRSNGVEMVVMNKAQYDAMKKAQPANGAKGEPGDLGKAFGEIFKELLSGFFQVGENDLAFIIKDPQQRLADLELLTAGGQVIKRRSSMSSRDMMVYSFDDKLPDGAELKIYLATPKAVVRVPIALKDVVLP
jgi:hypothetical protein